MNIKCWYCESPAKFVRDLNGLKQFLCTNHKQYVIDFELDVLGMSLGRFEEVTCDISEE